MGFGATANEDVTSKFPNKLARDIYLSNDIGRDPNVDPFTTRDITKIFGDARKLERGATTLCYADKPKLRHSPSPVNMMKLTGRNTPGGTRSGTPCEGNYTPKELEAKTVISFTKDARWGEERSMNAAMLRREVVRKQKAMELGVALQRARVDLNPPPMISKPNTNKTPAIGNYSGRKMDTLMQEKHLAQPFERFTTLPWEAHKAKLAKHAVQLNLPTGGGAPVTKPSVTFTGGGGTQTGRSVGKSLTYRSVGTSEGEEEEERWKAERALLIQRMGLGAGGSNRDRKKKQHIQKGADFASLAPRAAPMWNQPRGKETHDLMYKPSHDLTSNSRAHSATVRLGSYASRENLETRRPFIDVADRILQFENLVKFHERQKLNAKRSVFALPEERVTDDDDERAGEKGRRGMTVELGLSRIDDFSLHPESTRPPQRGLYAPQMSTSPSLFLYSDRPDTAISQVLGGVRQIASASAPRRLIRDADGTVSSPSYYTQPGNSSSPSTAS
jgi:hypothetical protein